MSETRSDKRNTKELKVLELYNQGLSYRKIASFVHLSLRDVTRFVNLASNKIKSPSVTSINDEIILEYSPAPDYRFELNIPSSKDIEASQLGLVRPSSPKKKLLDIVSQSPRIKVWLVNCIGDCMRYNNKAGEDMNNLYIELSQEGT